MSGELPIGMFDSGVGGLTVLREVLRLLPNESVIYFADTARIPYGEKSKETILRYSLENAEFLTQQKIKLLVVACNTAASCSVEMLRSRLAIPVVEVIEPGVEAAIKATKSGRIGVLGTRRTIESGLYQKKITERLPGAEITGIACPLFVPLVEESWLSHDATKLVIKEYLAPLHKKKIDTLLLGCTHYPLLRALIAEELDPSVILVDSAYSVAQTLKETLHAHEILSARSTIAPHQFVVSDDPEKFARLGESFLGQPIGHVKRYP